MADEDTRPQDVEPISDLSDLSDISDLSEDESDNALDEEREREYLDKIRRDEEEKQRQQEARERRLQELREEEREQRRRRQESEEDDEEYPEEDLEGTGRTKKKSHKRRREKAEKPRRQKKDELPPGLDKETEDKILQVRKDFDEALAAGATSRRRVKDYDETAYDEIYATFVAKMKQAAEKDADANRAREPGFNRLQMLKDVQSILERTNHHSLLLDNNILSAIKLWLEPLADGSLPSYSIRSAIFSILQKLPVDTEHLRESGVGRVAVFYSKCPRETPEIKKIASELILRWSRPILNKTDDYRMVSIPQTRVDPSHLQPSSPHVPRIQGGIDVFGNSSQVDNGADANRKFARIPQKVAADFRIRPESLIDPSMIKAKKTDKYKRIKQTLNRKSNSSQSKRRLEF